MLREACNIMDTKKYGFYHTKKYSNIELEYN